MSNKDIGGVSITDKYNDSLVFRLYRHLETSELRVQIYWEPEEETHYNYLIDNDIQVDLSLDVFLKLIDKIPHDLLSLLK